MTKMLNVEYPSSPRVSRLRPLVRRSLIITLAAGAIAGSISAPALAAPGETDTATITANVQVLSSITLTGLAPAFTMSGLPGAAVTEVVPYNVETNNPGGYSVVVTAAGPVLTPATTGNPDTIPVANLTVEDANGAPTPMNNTVGVEVNTKTSPSVAGGDPLTSNYAMTIPFVQEDTYSVDLSYVATTL